MNPAVKIELIDDARGDTLVVLAGEKQETIRTSCENVCHRIGVVRLNRPNVSGACVAPGEAAGERAHYRRLKNAAAR